MKRKNFQDGMIGGKGNQNTPTGLTDQSGKGSNRSREEGMDTSAR